MFIDLIIVVAIVVAVILYFKRFSSFVYMMCALDILYRLLHFLADNLPVPELTSLINKYVPTSLLGLFSNYVGTEGIFFIIVNWAIFLLYSILLFYIIRILVKRK